MYFTLIVSFREKVNSHIFISHSDFQVFYVSYCEIFEFFSIWIFFTEFYKAKIALILKQVFYLMIKAFFFFTNHKQL